MQLVMRDDACEHTTADKISVMSWEILIKKLEDKLRLTEKKR